MQPFSRQNIGAFITSAPYPTIINLCNASGSIYRQCKSEPFNTMIQKKKNALVQKVSTMPLGELKQFCNDETRPCDIKIIRAIVKRRLPLWRLWISVHVEKHEEGRDVSKAELQHIHKWVTEHVNWQMSGSGYADWNWKLKSLKSEGTKCIDEGDKIVCVYYIDIPMPVKDMEILEREYPGKELETLRETLDSGAYWGVGDPIFAQKKWYRYGFDDPYTDRDLVHNINVYAGESELIVE